MKDEMKANERFLSVLKGEKTDRLPVYETSPWWDQTEYRWKKEGLDPSLSNEQMQEYFGLDLNISYLFRSMTGDAPPNMTVQDIVKLRKNMKNLKNISSRCLILHRNLLKRLKNIRVQANRSPGFVWTDPFGIRVSFSV